MELIQIIDNSGEKDIFFRLKIVIFSGKKENRKAVHAWMGKGGESGAITVAGLPELMKHKDNDRYKKILNKINPSIQAVKLT